MNNTCAEWCPHCEQEVELPYGRKYFNCPNCNKVIAPCNQFSHFEKEKRSTGIEMCICLD